MTQDRLEEIISNPNADTARVKSLVGSYMQEQNKAEWNQAQQAEYDLLYPATRDMTDAEKTANDTDEDGNTIGRDTDYVYPQVPIQYITTDDDGNETRTPSDYVTYSEWMAETKIVIPAVAEVKDDNGNITTPAKSAVTEPVRVFVPKEDYSADIDTYMTGSSAYKARLKEVKLKELNTLKVEANTILYDANGKALGNMASVVAVANWKYNQAVVGGTAVDDAYKAVYKDTILNWRGADNVVHQVQVESICEALEASMKQIAVVIGVS